MYENDDHQQAWDWDRGNVGVCQWGLEKKKAEEEKERERREGAYKGRQISKGVKGKIRPESDQ